MESRFANVVIPFIMTDKKIDNFLGAPFGSSISSVKEFFNRSYDTVFDEKLSDNDCLFFNGVKYEGRATTLVLLHFVNDKFAKGSAFMKAANENEILPMFRQLVNEINAKYYITDQDYANYTAPFEKDDGYSITAIAKDKLTVSAYWNFVSANKEDDYITARINNDMEIIVSYEDGYLMNLLVEGRKNSK